MTNLVRFGISPYKFFGLYDQILDDMTNILSEIWSTYYPSMEELDTFAGQISDFLRKHLVHATLPSFLHQKLTYVRA